jgi:hypothetical protein
LKSIKNIKFREIFFFSSFFALFSTIFHVFFSLITLNSEICGPLYNHNQIKIDAVSLVSQSNLIKSVITTVQKHQNKTPLKNKSLFSFPRLINSSFENNLSSGYPERENSIISFLIQSGLTHQYPNDDPYLLT